MTSRASDLVWLSTRNIRITRPPEGLDYKRPGPYRTSEVKNDRRARCAFTMFSMCPS